MEAIMEKEAVVSLTSIISDNFESSEYTSASFSVVAKVWSIKRAPIFHLSHYLGSLWGVVISGNVWWSTLERRPYVKMSTITGSIGWTMSGWSYRVDRLTDSPPASHRLALQEVKMKPVTRLQHCVFSAQLNMFHELVKWEKRELQVWVIKVLGRNCGSVVAWIQRAHELSHIGCDFYTLNYSRKERQCATWTLYSISGLSCFSFFIFSLLSWLKSISLNFVSTI